MAEEIKNKKKKKAEKTHKKIELISRFKYV